MALIIDDLTPLAPIPDDLPPRPWLVPGLLMRNQVTLLSAAGGMGKSMLALQIALMCCHELAWIGWQPNKAMRVLYIGSEDDLTEKHRRVAAASGVMKVKPPPTLHTLPAFKLVGWDPEADAGPLVRTAECDALIGLAQDYELVILDPLIEFQANLNENDNTHMEHFASAVRDVARLGDCAVLLVHHHRKGGAGGSQDSARGASSLLASVRVALTLMDMKTPDDVSDELAQRLRSYRELQGSKSNYSARSGVVTLQLKSVQLDNGDNVGVFVEPENIFNIDRQRVLDEVERRVSDGKPFCVSTKVKKTERLDAWIVVNFEVPEKSAREFIDDLLGLGWLEVFEHKDNRNRESKRYRTGEGQDGIPF